jgi:hypothetical protein
VESLDFDEDEESLELDDVVEDESDLLSDVLSDFEEEPFDELADDPAPWRLSVR